MEHLRQRGHQPHPRRCKHHFATAPRQGVWQWPVPTPLVQSSRVSLRTPTPTAESSCRRGELRSFRPEIRPHRGMPHSLTDKIGDKRSVLRPARQVAQSSGKFRPKPVPPLIRGIRVGHGPALAPHDHRACAIAPSRKPLSPISAREMGRLPFVKWRISPIWSTLLRTPRLRQPANPCM